MFTFAISVKMHIFFNIPSAPYIGMSKGVAKNRENKEIEGHIIFLFLKIS